MTTPEHDGPTAAERYASYQRDKAHPVFRDFRAGYPFPLDDFQVEGCKAVEDGDGVLVAAPTGAGKTVVGEFAVHLALETGRKCFYTTPIKALSNQKYSDLVDRYGADRVGLLTGDTSVNGEAPVVVMTTEVLRNMLYARSQTLTGLGFVVMDEVHYLADRARGAVWEEVIIHLPESVSVVSLSATVSNAEEFGEWLETVRGTTRTIVAERRPVPLFQHVMVGRRLLDLFASSDVDAAAGFVREGAPVNDELMKLARDDWASSRLMRDRRSPRKGKPGSSKNPRAVGNGRRIWIPSRIDVIDQLQRKNLLPAIDFIFSRAGCDAAVQQCLDANLRLTDADERDEVIDYVERTLGGLPSDDLHVLGYHDFLDAASRGIAAHHAGMLPAFKECVEELYLRGLIKIVFATETLALGINMPARTVVLEKLSKWNGETHADITPGEYTQLTGRAGRRGLDVEGHAVVLWQPGMNPRELAGLASTRTYPLRSSFRPSYNMAVNLVHSYGRHRSRELLEQSFAQFQADRAVVGLARQLRKAEDALAGYAEAAQCHLGDFMEYAGLRRRISELEKEASKVRRQDRRSEAEASLERLRPGDVIVVPVGKFAGPAVIVDPGLSEGGHRPLVITAERQGRRLAMMDFPTPVEPVARIRLPRKIDARNPHQRKDIAQAVREAVRALPPSVTRPRAERGPVDAETAREISSLRAQVREHPCHGCAEREDHARWAERHAKLEKDTQTLAQRIERRTNTVARTFDRVCEVLEALEYLHEDEVSDRGRGLMRIYSDLDLVAAESLRRGLWDDLSPSQLGAVLSALVYEARRPEDAPPAVPGGAISLTIDEMIRVWADLERLEREHRLDFLRRPDPGFAWTAYRWAEGHDLDEVITRNDQTAGDFVRQMKQLIDFAGQIADAAAGTPVRDNARALVKLLRRGIVASD
ncbi:ATP-dependent RNA helicase HelY [Nocardioides sp. J9]|uniref:DEAD/DEAH box helicase n=1 Tax=unclassified Nocardioides TaxID=2615069 RepID=UPI000490EF6A|nr:MULTISPECIES: DEAD/DEAH box helicase [unclassified Nocardioides]TWH03892.1 ATP-dependent RNA helicase HelY [Nocardioides sp. J9]